MRALVLASHYRHYEEFMRRVGLSKSLTRFVDGYGGFLSIAGYSPDTTVVLLDGYERNPKYDLWFMWMIGLRFNTIGFLSEEEWMGYENSKF